MSLHMENILVQSGNKIDTNEVEKLQQNRIDTRRILKQKGHSPDNDIYFIPGYLRLKYKNFIQMDLQNLSAEMNATLIFTVYYGDLNPEIVKKLQSEIVFNFGRDDAIKLTKEKNLQISVKNKGGEIQFTIRKIFKLRIESEVFFTPFELINCILSISIQPVSTQWGTVKINLMDHSEQILKTSYSQEGAFGTYGIATKKMASIYSNDRLSQVSDFYKPLDQRKREYQQSSKYTKLTAKSRVQHFQFSHFNIPLYKFPWVSLATIFLPLWLLAIINLAIYFQDTSMNNRMGSLATLMIAYIALVPTIRENIPPNPRIVFTEILVYLNAFSSILVWINSINVRDAGSDYVFVWSDSWQFLISVIIAISSFVLVVVMMILHYLILMRTYKMDTQQGKDLKFKRKQWNNQLCDMYFTKVNNLKNQKQRLLIIPDSIQFGQKLIKNVNKKYQPQMNDISTI